MDINLGEYLQGAQISIALLIPVALVFFGAILVFTFGFQKAEEPKFKKISSTLSSESSSKRAKKKDKNTTARGTPNGNVALESGSASPAAAALSAKKQMTSAASTAEGKSASGKKDEKSKQKDIKDKKKDTKEKSKKSPAAVQSSKSGKVAKSVKSDKTKKDEKPVDFDDGEWLTVPSRTDKKKEKDAQVATAVSHLTSEFKKTLTAKAFESVDISAKIKKSETKNQKQLKDQENKFKKEAADAKKNNKQTVKVSAQQTTSVFDSNVNNNAESNIDFFVELKASPNQGSQIESTPTPPVTPSTSPDAGIASVTKQVTDLDAVDIQEPEQVAVSGGNVAFDELGDAWTEAKMPKKSKKKSRKE